MATKPLFCDDCGTRNTPDSKYCKECGAMLSVSYQTLALTEHDRIDDPTDQERLTQFLDMAFWHNEAGNIDAAVRACRAALAINPNSTTGLSLLGSLCERQGDDAQAIAHFERVLALNPDSGADQVKLAQLKEGIHVKPLRASPVYRWLPFALGSAGFSEFTIGLRERWANLRRPEMSLPPARTTYVLAGVVAFCVIVGAFLLSKPSPSVPADAATTVPSAAHSAYGSPSSPYQVASRPVIPPLITLPARPGTPLLPPPSEAGFTPSGDPFAGQAFVPMTSNLPRGYAQGRARSTVAGHLHALPPLVAVPDASNGPLPPAPISVEANAPIPANSDMARHTVIVHHLNGLSEFSAPNSSNADVIDNGASGDGDNQDTAPGPSSSIQISVDPSTDNSQGSSSAGSGGASGEDDQQSAFTLQQQGHYRQASALYSKAIAAYQAEISSGQNVDAAQRGLQACQTGLQICRQNQ